MTSAVGVFTETFTSEVLMQGTVKTVSGGTSTVHEVVAAGPIGPSGSASSLSADDGNQAEARADGIYVPTFQWQKTDW